MPGFRPAGFTGEVLYRRIAPGDLMLGGESILAGVLNTVGNGVWTAAAIATGIIRRTGPVGGFTDTTDTAANICAALAGNAAQMDQLQGTSFRLAVQNTVAQALTFAAGAGVIAGTGTLNIANSLVREYLVTILNATPPQTIQSNTTNNSAAVTFVLPSGAVALPLVGSNGLSGVVAIAPGMTVSGTGITAGTTVLGIVQGQGGAIGVTLSAVATATSVAGGTPLTFTPTVQFDSIGTYGL